MRLRELDSRWVPRMAARVGRWAHQAVVRRDRAQELVRAVDGDALRRLDERATQRGVLAVVREVPQLGIAVIALLLFVSCVAAGKLEADRQRQQQTAAEEVLVPSEELGPAEGTALGPEVGTTTEQYEIDAGKGLDEALQEAPDARRVALVSLDRYLTPAQAVSLLTGYDVKRVYLRSRAAGKEAAQLPVEIKAELGAELAKAYRTTAEARRVAQKAYQGYVDTITVTTAEEQAFKDQYVAFAKSTGIEARDYAGQCACVYAVVVEGGAAALRILNSKPGVRAVEVAGKGRALGSLQIRPLLPELRGAVKKQTPVTDANP